MELVWSPDTLDDIERAIDYISSDLDSPLAAERLLNSIFEKAQLFSDFPGAGTALHTQSGIDTGYRYMICGNWTIFFCLQDAQALVVRVLYGKSDYMRTLFGEIDE